MIMDYSKKDINNIKQWINKEDFVNIHDFLIKGDISLNILFFKRNEFLVDRHNHNQYNSLINSIKKLSSNNYILIKYLDELVLINKVYNDISGMQEAIKRIPDKHILPTFFRAYNQFIKNILSPQTFKQLKKIKADVGFSVDRGISLINDTFKSLCYNQELYKDNQFLFSEANIIERIKYYKILYTYIDDSLAASVWEDTFLFWKAGAYEISVKDGGIRVSFIDKSIPYYFFCISIKEMMYRRIRYSEYINISNNIYSNRRLKKELNEKELNHYFYGNINDILINGIRVKEWLKAYNALRDYAIKDFPILYSTSNLFHICTNFIRKKSKDKWIKFFIKKGIDEESAEYIFEKLLFTKSATDLQDHPFVKIKDKFAILPSVMKQTEPAYALISRFERNDMDLTIKGKSFEDYIRNRLNMYGITTLNLHNKINGIEQECDIAFFIKDTLFFCECKSRVQYRINNLDFSDMEQDVEQLEKTVSFYLGNYSYLAKEFSTKGIFLPKKLRIAKFIVYSRAVHTVIKKKDTYLLDAENFLMPFDRADIARSIIAFGDEKIHQILSGEITPEKLFDFYNMDIFLGDYVNRIDIKMKEFQLGNNSLFIETFYYKEEKDPKTIINDILHKDEAMKRY